MTDILDQIVGGTDEGLDLSQLTTPLTPAPVPSATLKNRAAITTLLTSQPESLVSDYQAILSNEEAGHPMVDPTMDEFFAADGKRDMNAVMSVLADPNVDMERKRGAIEAMYYNPVLKDSGTSLLTRGLESESDGETLEAEEARISTADALFEMYDARNQVQGLVNAHVASLATDRSASGIASLTADVIDAIVAPFATNKAALQLAKGLAEKEGRKFTLWDTVKSFVAAGTTVADIRKQLGQLPPEQQIEYTKNILNVISSNSDLIFTNDNQYNQFIKAQNIFAEGGYDSVDEFIDNAVILLDVVGIGQALRVGSKAKAARINKGVSKTIEAPIKATPGEAIVSKVTTTPENNRRFKKNKIVDAIERIDANATVRQENPAAVINIMHNSNPQQARAMFAGIVEAEGDAFAQGVAGVGKTQAIVNDTFPQALTDSAEVTAKTTDVQRILRQNPDLSAEIKYMLQNSDVAIHYSQEEIAAAKSNIVNDFSNATDLVPNDTLGGFRSGFKTDGSGVEISAVYGTKEGAFASPDGLLEHAEFALRNQGVKRDEIEILQKQGNDYVPVDPIEVQGMPGSYLVRVNVRRDVDPTDITNFENIEVSRFNLFDRIPLAVWENTGSVSRWIFDASSLLGKRLTGAGVVATDLASRFEKNMLDLAKKFSDQYVKFDKTRRAKIDEYLKESNFKGLEFDQADLIGRGFNEEEIASIRSWRDFWDGHFLLENLDVVRTMNAQGYQIFQNASTTLYARPLAKNTQIGRVYDPSTGQVITVEPQFIDELYNKGGTVARLRRPSQFSFDVPYGDATKAVTETAEYMIVRNSPDEYLRKLRDTDQVLNYRHGYYQIQYSAPRFVDEITLDSSGREAGRRAIAVAGDTKEANNFSKRMSIENPDKRYVVRGDAKAMVRGSDDWFDLNNIKGRIAQKHRGKLLEDATGINHLGDGTYIVNPVESAVRAARSIAGRTVTRPMLEAAKARFMAQFSDVVLNTNGFGGKMFPSSVKQIGAKGEIFSKRVADARTSWEYIRYLENGYINSVDEFVKSSLNATATALGEMGVTKAERAALKGSEIQGGPNQFAKNFVFHAYIGLNPLRNWIVQTNQIARTFAYNPQVWLTGRMPKLSGELLAYRAGLLSNPSKEIQELARFVTESGLFHSIDKQNLVRGSLLDAAASTSRPARIAKEALSIPRQVGFDAGEAGNLLGHAIAVFDKYKRAGKDMSDTRVIREAQSEVRAISYDMNFAGDMPYNQTSANALLQFMQVPHKALLQVTNKRIPAGDRARMILGDVVLWGVPTGLISSVMGGDISPDDPLAHEIWEDGIQSTILNSYFSAVTGEDVAVDFSSLAPYSMDGFAKVFYGMFTGGLNQLIMNSPAGQLFLAEGGRVQSAIGQMARFFSPFQPIERTPEEAAAVINEVAKIASGWNNAMKAKQMFEAKKVLDKYGNVLDPKVNNLEAVMQLFGFTTQDVKKLYDTQRIVAEGSKQFEAEVKETYKQVKQYYQNAFASGIQDVKQMTAITGQLLMVYKDSPEALKIIQGELSKDIAGKDIQLMYQMMKSAGISEFGITIDQIKNSNASPEHKELYIQRLDDARKAREEINKEK